MKFHKWVIEERDKLTVHPADPFEAAKVWGSSFSAWADRAAGGGYRDFLCEPCAHRCRRCAAAGWPGVRTGKANCREGTRTAGLCACGCTAAEHRQLVQIAAAAHAVAQCPTAPEMRHRSASHANLCRDTKSSLHLRLPCLTQGRVIGFQDRPSRERLVLCERYSFTLWENDGHGVDYDRGSASQRPALRLASR